MCRLAAYLGSPQPAGRVFFEGDHALLHQSYRPREMIHGTVNADGWGVAWYHDGRPVRLARVEPPWYDAGLPAALGAIRSGCVVAALRNATPGLPVDASGLAPLVFGRWVFALNGAVPAFRARHMRALREDLPDDLYGELRGSSDTETLFMMIVAQLRDGAGPARALSAVAASVLERVGDADESLLTMILGDGDALVACRSSNRGRANSLYVGRGDPWPEDGVVLASEPLDRRTSWEPVPVHGLVEVRDGRVTVGELG